MTSNDHPSPDETSTLSQLKTKLPAEIVSLLNFLSLHPRIVFKSQQRNDPELLPSEKVLLAQEIYNRNPQIFLSRFGSYMEEQHLKDFARFSIAEGDEELYDLVRNYSRKLQTRQQDVKNRRYAALQDLIRGGEYFSEQEVMKRAPDLYYEMVGQYLSHLEKKKRDGYDVRTTSMSGIVFHTIEQKEMSLVMKKAADKLQEDRSLLWQKEAEEMLGQEKEMKKDYEIEEKQAEEESLKQEKQTEIADSSGDVENDEDELNLVPLNYRHQWGVFEDDEQIACSTSTSRSKPCNSKALEKIKKSKKKMVSKEQKSFTNEMITATERDLLRQEFMGIMYEHFLSGKDEDFDYSTVDDNTQFDDLQQINRDKEDEYFAETDEESEYSLDKTSTTKEIDKTQTEASDSEDELDIYMKHLKRHHSFQQ